MPKPTKKSKTKRRSTKGSKAEAVAKSAAESKPEFGLKSKFVRSKPDMTAPELVAAAAAEGIEITAGHVYNIRSTDNKKRGHTPAPTLNGQAEASATAVETPSGPSAASQKAPAQNARGALKPTARPVLESQSRSSGSSSPETQLRTLILRVGLDRVEEIFSDLKASLSVEHEPRGTRRGISASTN